MRIGFIGLGIMGSRMAQHLVNNNYDVTVYNRTKEKANALINQGAGWTSSPQELGEKVDVLFTMLISPEVVKKMAFGEEGFLNALKEGALWIDSSTVNPSFSLEMAGEARRRKVGFVDAPVLGSKAPAESGELITIAGGEEEDFKKAEPLLKTFSKSVKHVGGPGKGTSLKMVFNMLIGQTLVAFSEAVQLGESLGLEKSMLLDTLLQTPITAPYLNSKRDFFDQDRKEAQFALKNMYKDLHLVALTGYEQNVPMHLTNLTKEIFASANRDGYGEFDFATIYQYLKEDR